MPEPQHFQTWRELPAEVQDDLIAWFNQAGDIDRADRRRLARLYGLGDFKAWDCPECGARCRLGTPSDWNHFQGVEQVDHTSYPGDSDKYTPDYLALMCDQCRMKPRRLSGARGRFYAL